MLKIFRYMRKRELGFIFLSIVFVVAQVWLDLKLPDYMSEVTMLVQTEGSKMSDIWTAGGKMLLCAFGSLISAIIRRILRRSRCSRLFKQTAFYGIQ